MDENCNNKVGLYYYIFVLFWCFFVVGGVLLLVVFCCCCFVVAVLFLNHKPDQMLEQGPRELVVCPSLEIFRP